MSNPRTEARLTELVLLWEEHRAEGRVISPESLCETSPELIEALRERIASLSAMDRFLDGVTETSTPGQATTTAAEPFGSPAPPPPLSPTDFEILGELGQGGMGVVYRAFDRRRREIVALKTMQWLHPDALDRFKREFRAAADLNHPNLATLHELVFDGRNWFFTMELIDGVNFLRHVREESSEEPPTLPDEHLGASESSRAITPAHTTPLPAEPGYSRLRDALGQLASGLSALHDAGRLHRDVKPSNVLVTPSGRAVLLDFGLAAELGPTGLHRSTGRVVRGTLAYMSPEQASGRPLASASDWYSVGVLLYEALTGNLPFGGLGVLSTEAFRASNPPTPRAMVPDIPDDLDSLCRDLLREEPSARPDGQEVLRRLGVGGRAPTEMGAPPTLATRLVGRDRHIAFLSDLLDQVATGRTVVVRLHGASGAGKSALARAFLERLETSGRATVMSGCCHEREAVPYKALDGLIDALGKHLRGLDRAEVEAILPRDALSLARVFPALKRVEAIAAAPRRGFDVPDPRELRRRAFAGLRDLLGRLGDRHPLVLALDDLQWGDVDSAALLAEVLREPDPPWLMLLACHRDEDVAASPFLQAFLQLAESPRTQVGRVGWESIEVEPLGASDARALAVALLGAAGPSSEAVARESGGNPFFVGELVRSLQEGEPTESGVARLDDVLRRRVSRLPDPARRLLEVVAVSGRPLRREDAVRAARLSSAVERSTLALLATARLIRSAGASGRDSIEPYHDRVREAVATSLDPDTLRERHRALSEALEAAGTADAEALGIHFRGAGEPEKAAFHLARAAAEAAEALAFDRATSLYRLALELASASDRVALSLPRRLGDALANAGRGADAARAYLDAASSPGATAAESFDLRRLAATQWLVSGHIQEGLATLRDVLATLGWTLQSSPFRTLVSLLYRRTLLRLRGMSFRRRGHDEASPAELARIDVCWTAVAGLSMVDFIRGADFQARGLLLALRTGEPTRVARAVAMEAAHSATAGVKARERTSRLLARSRRLAEEAGDPYALGMADLAEGSAAYLEGRWRAASTSCDKAAVVFRSRCKGVAWETVTAHSFALWSLSHIGDFQKLTTRWPVLLREAGERGDLYAVMNLNTYLMSIVRLAADDPEGARDALRINAPRWSRDTGYHVQHNDELWAITQVSLYQGDGLGAWSHIAERWPALRRSLLLRVQFVRVAMTWLRGRCALAAATASNRAGASPLLHSAQADARRLAREGAPWATAVGRLLEAGLAESRGDSEGAIRLLDDAEMLLLDVEMTHCAAAARRNRGRLVGGDEGNALVQQADARLSAQAVLNPSCLVAMLAPGFERARP